MLVIWVVRENYAFFAKYKIGESQVQIQFIICNKDDRGALFN